MDSHFVSNMPLGLEAIAQLRPKTALPFDAHLMVERNDLFIARAYPHRRPIYIGARRDSHPPGPHHQPHQSRRGQAGVALNPATPLTALEYVLDNIDFVLIMTVNPGFAGQKLVFSALRKIADCRKMLQTHGRNIPIQVDGNVSFEHIPGMVAAGADILVAAAAACSSARGRCGRTWTRPAWPWSEGLRRREKEMHA